MMRLTILVNMMAEDEVIIMTNKKENISGTADDFYPNGRENAQHIDPDKLAYILLNHKIITSRDYDFLMGKESFVSWKERNTTPSGDTSDDLIKRRSNEPKGEWGYGEDESGQDGWFCSECDFFVPWYYAYYENDINFIRDYKVCPHCMAEMISYTGKDRDDMQKDPGDSK